MWWEEGEEPREKTVWYLWGFEGMLVCLRALHRPKYFVIQLNLSVDVKTTAVHNLEAGRESERAGERASGRLR
jgi:hypothetical protein